MPIQELAPLTFDEIVADLRAFEKKYGMSTVDFLSNPCADAVDDDDAMEWSYRVEQFRALQQGGGSRDSRTERATSLNSRTNVIEVMNRLAA